MSPDLRRIFFIFNPASGRGRGQERISRYRELLDRHIPGWEHGITARSGDEARLAGDALRGPYETIVAVGGDGTWSQVADRILASGRTDVRFGILPSGTGNDFGRSLGIRGDDPESAVLAVAKGATQVVDVGCVVTASSHDGREDPAVSGRHFLNVVGFGFDIAVVDAAQRARLLRGALLYKTTALQQLFRFPGFHVALQDEEGWERSGPSLMLTVSNGRYFGGGFPIAPRATLQDGALHACLIRDGNPLVRLGLFGRVGKGRHEGQAHVETRSAAAFLMRFPEPVRFEIDGDVYVAADRDVRVEVKSAALRVAVPA